MRTSRPKTPVIYGPDETFPIGGSKVLRQSGDDVATVVGVGVTVFEALKAYDQLFAEGIAHPRHRRLLAAADRRRHAHRRGPGHRRADHHGRGSLRRRAGLGDAVSEAVVVSRLQRAPARGPRDCRAAASRTSSSSATASPPGTSSTPSRRCSRPAVAEIGRNDPCPCGSGRKYKKCCLAKDEAAWRVQAASGSRPRGRHRPPPGRSSTSPSSRRISMSAAERRSGPTVSTCIRSRQTSSLLVDEPGFAPSTSTPGSCSTSISTAGGQPADSFQRSAPAVDLEPDEFAYLD